VGVEYLILEIRSLKRKLRKIKLYTINEVMANAFAYLASFEKSFKNGVNVNVNVGITFS
jgi:hypothetical protein